MYLPNGTAFFRVGLCQALGGYRREPGKECHGRWVTAQHRRFRDIGAGFGQFLAVGGSA
ncbi:MULTISPECIES: hypothetical protein [unclassified Arthrobacter]|uniref:hypothetical protein n=1 Tax=unclassified Arthrobacter TaxID=235627 RepID=UPI0033956E5D